MNHPESITQKACVKWFRVQYPNLGRNLFSIPNGAELQGNSIDRAKQWHRLQAEGATPGTADLFLARPSAQFHGMFIEMKSQTGKLSDTQIAFRESVIKQGYAYVVCRDLYEFMKTINNYLSYQ